MSKPVAAVADPVIQAKFTAKCCIAEARRVRNNPVCRNHYWHLLSWASNARLRARAYQLAALAAAPVQSDLFGGAGHG